MSLGNWMENRTLNHIFGKQIYTPQALYVGLCRANPGEGGSGSNCNEVTNANGYARTAFSAKLATAGIIYNASEVLFPLATGNWGVVTHFALFTSGTYGSGYLFAYSALSASRNVTQYSRPRFALNALSITLD